MKEREEQEELFYITEKEQRAKRIKKNKKDKNKQGDKWNDGNGKVKTSRKKNRRREREVLRDLMKDYR